MNIRLTIAGGLILLLLSGCGGSSSDSAPISFKAGSQSTSDSEGRFVLPTANTMVDGNILVSVEVSDLDGLQSVYLRFNDSSEQLILCTTSLTASATNSCGSTTFSQVENGIYPGNYNAEPGPLRISLWVTDSTQTTTMVATTSIDWQPKSIEGFTVVRSTSGQQAEVVWQENPDLLRYNLYIATQSGVNIENYQTLDEGQAAFALTQPPFVFENLEPTQTYYILLAGIDGSGESARAQEFILLPNDQTNFPPQANDDDETIDEDESATFAPLDNDSDPDGDPLTLLSANADSGQVTVNGNELDYQPLFNFNGQATITYQIGDPFGATDNAQITVTILAVNDPPETQDDSASTTINDPINVDVLANDSDPDGDNLTITNVEATNGSVDIENDGTLTYQPDLGFVGIDDVVYEVSDGNGLDAQGILTVTVSNSDLPPQAQDDSYDMVENTVFSILKSSGVLLNDSDPNNDALTVNTIPVQNPNSGVLTLNSDGSFNYTPNSDFFGVDTFVYEVLDQSNLSDTATVTINVQQLPEDLIGDSTSISGQFRYIGRGETSPGSGVGTGLYRIGDCLQIIDTYCSFVGTYQEAGNSGNQPNEIGSYAMVMTYPGTGESPVVAQSNAPGSDILFFTDLGNALFELYLFPPSGQVIKSAFPDPNFATLQNFGAYIIPPLDCQGLPNNTECKIGNVGLTVDAVLTANLDVLDFVINGYATVDVSSEPVALEDQFVTSVDQVLAVNAPGVLDNDNDADITVIGDTLEQRNAVLTALNTPVAIAADEYRQLLYVYAANTDSVSVYDRSGAVKAPLPWQGESANDADLDVAPVALTMANVALNQGTLLMINGETDNAEIYAVDPQTGIVLAQLNTEFGSSHVVGGAYNPISKTFFLLQDNVPVNGQANQVAEIDPNTGEVISNFFFNQNDSMFDVSFGDLEINSTTGNLYLVSNLEGRIAEFTQTGDLVRYINLPIEVTSPSGIAINAAADRVWFVNNTNSSPIIEAQFSNLGQFPGMVATLITPTQNGTVTLNLDGSFTYSPAAGFSGEDSFIYQVEDQTGKFARASVSINVQ
ncbi:Ig-like domain-containing protein [Aliiglaciecola lipolytica]|uniref:Fibronectin type-III domain-containing protein n=1 Tax=Aliiglaciecola lipolytica E3 TaxID=1127673 RepID=K6Y423_9ALTE|nr:Ig-like domain-containing protein [Aliiglaciecola lipolytica]GAC13017.1 hypothetical protein GLIP_0370 [Aliiglaciecola lipolytica E3]